MSKYDAERALAIYKTFTKQTNLVVEFLSTARQYENATRLEIPKLKHAPTSLTSSLEEYLKDPDFEINRRQYLAQQDVKRGKKSTTNGASEPVGGFSKLTVNKGGPSKAFPDPKPAPQPAPAKVEEAKGPAPDLIDFFDSIELNQQPMASAPQQQMPGFEIGPQYQQQHALPQQTGISVPQQSFFPQNGQQPQAQNGGNFGTSNPFSQPQAQQPIQQNLNGAGFGGYSQQPIPQQQDLFSSAPQNHMQFSHPQQQFNTGDQSFGPPQRSFTTPQSFAPQQTGSSNPFRQSMVPQPTGASNSSYQSTPPIALPLQHQSTNPFARNVSNQLTGSMQSSPFASQPPAQGSLFTSPPAQLQQNTPFTSQPASQSQQLQSPVTPHRTGTNPFARTTSPPAASPLVSSQTGTNPFRQSVFTNQQTGQGWQASQGTMGGFEQLDTVPIFPRPGQPQQQQGAWP